MNAVILAPIVRDMQSANGRDAIVEFILGLPAPWLALAAVGGAVVCAVFGWIVRRLLCVFIIRRQLPAATNTVLESMAAVLLILVIGQCIGLALRAFGQNDILLRLAGTVLASLASVCGLAFMWRRRKPAGAFPWWDLRPHAGMHRLFVAMPLALVAYMPINIVAAVAWRCALVACDRPITLQDVLLEPLDREPLVVVVYGVLATSVVPLLEETVFRGGLYRALREDIGVGGAALISSLVFALLHFNETALLPLVLLALFLVVVYEWSGSLWACVLLHASFNGLNFTVA